MRAAKSWTLVGSAIIACGGGGDATQDAGGDSGVDAAFDVGTGDTAVDATDVGLPPTFTCTQHVTTSTFKAAFAAAAAGDVLCLAPGNYGNWTGGKKTSMVVLTPDVSASAIAPVGNAKGGTDGNVIFAGLELTQASFITLDGMTFTDDVDMPWGTTTGNVHDITIRNSIFHAHLAINDTTMENANIVIDYNLFPGDKADCINGAEGRIQVGSQNHSAMPDGVVIENNDIGGVSSVQCDGVQSGAYGLKITGNWFHDYHYSGAAHTDGIQLYGAVANVIIGNFFYDVPDGIVAYDGMASEDIENNIVVNDSTKDDGASPNQFDLLANSAPSVAKHNTIVGGLNSFDGTEGNLLIGSKGDPCNGLTLDDNVATSISNGDGGGNCTYTADYNLLQQGGGTGSHNVKGAPIYQGGDCGNLTVDPPGACSDKWSNFLLAPSSPGHLAAQDGIDIGAYGPGPKTPGGP